MRTSYLFALALIPLVARSEVMDKEPSLVVVLAVVFAGAIGAFLASRYRPLLLAAVLAFVGTFFAGLYAELLDPAVGPAMRGEAGDFYTFMSWSGLFFVVAGGVIGFLARRRRSASTRTE